MIKKTFRIIQRDFIHAGEASIEVKGILKKLHLDPDLVRRVAVCCFEGEMNVVMHGSDGVLDVVIAADSITLEISDKGKGIADIGLAMQEGFSTASEQQRALGFGAGMGLPNMKKNSDEFHIESEVDKGTKVRMLFNYST